MDRARAAHRHRGRRSPARGAPGSRPCAARRGQRRRRARGRAAACAGGLAQLAGRTARRPRTRRVRPLGRRDARPPALGHGGRRRRRRGVRRLRGVRAAATRAVSRSRDAAAPPARRRAASRWSRSCAMRAPASCTATMRPRTSCSAPTAPGCSTWRSRTMVIPSSTCRSSSRSPAHGAPAARAGARLQRARRELHGRLRPRARRPSLLRRPPWPRTPARCCWRAPTAARLRRSSARAPSSARARSAGSCCSTRRLIWRRSWRHAHERALDRAGARVRGARFARDADRRLRDRAGRRRARPVRRCPRARPRAATRRTSAATAATRYAGRGVRDAVAAVNGEIAALLRGRDAADQAVIDAALRDLDGTPSLVAPRRQRRAVGLASPVRWPPPRRLGRRSGGCSPRAARRCCRCRWSTCSRAGPTPGAPSTCRTCS